MDFLKQYLNPRTQLVDFAIPLPDEFYETVDGLELKTSEIKKIHSHGYTPREAKKSDVWKVLAQSQKRLDNYVDAVVAETGREQDLMNLYFGEFSTVPTGRLWGVNGRGGDSDALGDGSRTGDYGRLVGVAPKAHVGRAKK